MNFQNLSSLVHVSFSFYSSLDNFSCIMPLKKTKDSTMMRFSTSGEHIINFSFVIWWLIPVYAWISLLPSHAVTYTWIMHRNGWKSCDMGFGQPARSVWICIGVSAKLVIVMHLISSASLLYYWCGFIFQNKFLFRSVVSCSK